MSVAWIALLNKWLTRLELQDEVTDPITPSPYHLAVLSNKPWLSLFFSLLHISTPQLPSQTVNRCLIKVVSTSRVVGPANFTVFEAQIVYQICTWLIDSIKYSLLHFSVLITNYYSDNHICLHSSGSQSQIVSQMQGIKWTTLFT